MLVVQVACGWWTCYIFPPCPLVVGRFNPLRPKKYHHSLGLAWKLGGPHCMVWFSTRHTCANGCKPLLECLLYLINFLSLLLYPCIIGCVHRDFWVCDACNLAKWIQTPLLCALQQILFLFSCSQKREATTKEKKKGKKRSIFPFSHWFLDLGLSYT